MNRYYFDWAATTPMCRAALDRYVEVASHYSANPSSSYKRGKEASQFLTDERKKTASLLKTDPHLLYYTSGATHSNSIIFNSLLLRPKPGRVILSSIEHSSILEYQKVLEQKGFEVVVVPARGGYVDPVAIENQLTEETLLVSVMLANNVLGTVQPIKEISERIGSFERRGGRRKIHFHTDAVQAVGKMELTLGELGVDSASFSAHKFEGPRKVGLLYLNESIETLSKGGGQERTLVPGTEDLAAIASLNSALEHTLSQRVDLSSLRLLLEKKLQEYAPITLLSPSIESNKALLPQIVTIAVDRIPSEVFMRVMDDKGFELSSGSACSSKLATKAHRLLLSTSINLQEAVSAIRISFGPYTTEAEITLLSETLIEQATLLQKQTRRIFYE